MPNAAAVGNVLARSKRLASGQQAIARNTCPRRGQGYISDWSSRARMSDDGYLPEDDPAVELMLASRHGDLAYLRAHVDSFGQLDTLGDSVLGHAGHRGVLSVAVSDR